MMSATRGCTVLWVTLAALTALTPAIADDDDCSDQTALVRLAPGASIDAFNALYGSTTLDSIPSRQIYLLSVPTNYSDFVRAVAGDVDLLSIEQNCFVTDASPEGGTQTFFFNTAPNAYQNQPLVDLMELDAAQQVSRGAESIVAVIDTGVSPHPLVAPALLPGFNFLGGNTQTAEVGDGVDNDGDGLIDEMIGHGTFIAGLVLRVAPDARILPVRVMDDEGFSTTFLLTAGVYYAVDQGAHILNVSMGTITPSLVLGDALAEASSGGALLVASTGNEGNAEPVRYPAGYSLAIAVSATDDFDVRATFANYGALVDLCAPGVLVSSVDITNSFVAASGTSFSAPLVAGTLALLRQIDPGAPVELLRSVLLNNTDSVSAQNPGFEGLLGSGRANAAQAATDPLLCRGDIDFDRSVTILDLNILLANFGASGAAFAQGDINGDGAVGVDDLNLLLSNFGATCP